MTIFRPLVQHQYFPLRIKSHADPAHHSTGEQLLNIICFVYCGWILALGCRAWWKGGGDELLRGAGLPKFLMGISIVTLLILVPSIVMKSLSCRIQGEYVCILRIMRSKGNLLCKIPLFYFDCYFFFL